MGQATNMPQHVAQMNQQQQMLSQQQQMMTNGSPQFSAPATPISNNHVSPYQANKWVFCQNKNELIFSCLVCTIKSHPRLLGSNSETLSKPVKMPTPLPHNNPQILNLKCPTRFNQTPWPMVIIV